MVRECFAHHVHLAWRQRGERLSGDKLQLLQQSVFALRLGFRAHVPEIEMWIALLKDRQKKLSDVQAQRKALTAMLQSGGAPSSDLPYLRYLAGRSEEHTSELQSLMR